MVDIVEFAAKIPANGRANEAGAEEVLNRRGRVPTPA